MVFSSITFLIYFFPLVFGMYCILGFSKRLQNAWLLISSLFFYAWGEPILVMVMILCIVVNWLFGTILGHQNEEKKLKQFTLVTAVVFNLMILGIFKYAMFAIDSINSVMGMELFARPQIPYAIGVSFFTFQALAYVMDVYRGEAKVQKNIMRLGLYISFFPKLLAGPIIRYSAFEDQLINRKMHWNMICKGICRFVEGILKKVLLANQLAIVADNIFGLTISGSTDVPVSAMMAWVGAIAYTLQLYYDLSSYSDMAIGLGMVFGFTFPENFSYPFVSKSLNEFLARWHMSLSEWFRRYVYEPLGGAKDANQDRMVRNLFIVCLLVGIWHGAKWPYVCWGLFLFVFILFEKFFQFDRIEKHDGIRRVYTIVVVLLAMVIFRCRDIKQLALFLKDMFNLSGNGFYSDTALMFLREYGIVFGGAILFALPLRSSVMTIVEKMPARRIIKEIFGCCYIVGMFALFVFCIAILAKGGQNSFIYYYF